MEKESFKKLLIVGVFAIAMAFLECVVIIYLRKLYYPGGFNFPLAQVGKPVLMIEFAREFFTIVMLACVAFLAGRKIYDRFAYFLYAFAVWDIFYYVFLKLILNWPSSFLAWDLLFLVPVPWAGPVLAPILCSLTMILLALCIINLQSSGHKIKAKLREIALLIVGSLLIIYTFTIDYFYITVKDAEKIYSFVPSSYNWFVFVFGEMLIVAAIILFYLRTKKT